MPTEPPEMRMIDIARISTDPRYQREIEAPRVRKIVRTFDWNMFGALEINRRENGTYFVFDGQHRLEAARQLKLRRVPCIVLSGMGAEEEAAYFTKLQINRKGLNQIDRFRAQVFSGDPESIEIASIVEDLNLVIDRSRHSSTTISAIISLEHIYRRWGGAHLKYTLQEAKDIWQGDDGSLQGSFLDGFARFLAAYGDDRYNEATRERLAAIHPIGLMRRASFVRGGGSQMGHLIYAQLRRASKVRGAPRKTPVIH